MDLVKFGQLLYRKRKKLKFSLRDAAEKISISHSYLSILEKANDPRSDSPIKPTIDTLKFISDAYKFDINILLDLAGYDIRMQYPKKPYQGDELIEILPDKYKELFKEQNIGYVNFAHDMMKEDIDPETLMELVAITKKLREDIKNNKVKIHEDKK